MADLPEYFRSVAETGEETGLVSFSYDARYGRFMVAGRQVPARQFDPLDFDPVSLGINEAGIDVRSVGRYPLYLTPLMGRLLATPRLHEWARVKRRGRQELIEGTKHIVCGVYLHVLGDETDTDEADLDAAADALDPDSHIGFKVGRMESGGLHVQTLGNCACLGTAAEGVMIRGFDRGYGEYELHNADTRAQRVSLYAGLGHLAHRASRV